MSEIPSTPPANTHTSGSPAAKPVAPRLPSWTLWLVLGATAIALIAFVGGCAYRASSEKQLVEVVCSQIKGGRECLVSVTEGTMDDARVCWEMHQVCENGTKVKAEKCMRGTLVAGSKARTLLADSEFINSERCDKVTTTQIESLTVIENFTQLELQRK